MPLYSQHKKPKKIQQLFFRAQAGEISPIDFCRVLKQYGVDEALGMLYIHDAFSMRLDEAKEIVINVYYDSVDAWAAEIGNLIDELAAELRNFESRNNSQTEVIR